MDLYLKQTVHQEASTNVYRNACFIKFTELHSLLYLMSSLRHVAIVLFLLNNIPDSTIVSSSHAYPF